VIEPEDAAMAIERSGQVGARLSDAAPFWLSLGLIPLAVVGATVGGWTVVLMPLYAWALVSLLDVFAGLNEQNPDTETRESDLFWYRLITMIWFPIQFAVIYGMIWWVTRTDHLSTLEVLVLFFGVGVISGTIGIVYAHELLHQRNKLERWLGDLLLATVLYSHFRSEHLQVHHRWVGTPRDPVTARYNEGFHRYFFRVLRDCPPSAWRAEAAMLARRGLPVWHLSNPFWRYFLLQGAALALAIAIGGWVGLGLFLFQAGSAIWQLELTNYIEHYGLTRKHLGAGKYESVKPRHSWNASHKASNWLLINLQRHSDHHYKPARRFPLLQTYSEDEAPQLPYGYPAMTTLAMIPPLWRRVMNPRVRAWRRQFYPEVEDWKPYNRGETPMPAGAS
jgi:alkane 1-monooxygenase